MADRSASVTARGGSRSDSVTLSTAAISESRAATATGCSRYSGMTCRSSDAATSRRKAIRAVPARAARASASVASVAFSRADR